MLFTTLAGAAQGLIVTIALAELASLPMSTPFLSSMLASSLAVLLLAAALRLAGRRAWQALPRGRGAWQPRERAALVALLGVAAGWWFALRRGSDLPWLPPAAVLLAAALWLCSAMVFAGVRSVREWAQPLTLLHLTLAGLSCGLLLACAAAVRHAELALQLAVAPLALAVTVAAAATRLAAWRRGAAPPGPALRFGAVAVAFLLPAALLAWGQAGGPALAWMLAPMAQVPGLLADRWLFLAAAHDAAPTDPDEP